MEEIHQQILLQELCKLTTNFHFKENYFNFFFFIFSSVRRAFDRVVPASEETINLSECQIALSCLGYPNNIQTVENLTNIILSYKLMKSSSQNVTTSSQNPSSDDDEEDEVKITSQSTSSENKTINDEDITFNINFDDFCVITAYLSVLQQEINNSTCVSPIKGINLPPPPIFLTNTPGTIFFLFN